MGENILDIVIITTVGIFALMGFARGLIKELSGLVAVISGILTGFRLSDSFSQIFEKMGISPGIASVVSFVIVFLVIAGGVMFIFSVLHKLVKGINLGWADRLFGLIFGFAKGSYIISFALIFLSLFSFITSVDTTLKRSKFSPFFTELAPRTYRMLTGKEMKGGEKISHWLSEFTGIDLYRFKIEKEDEGKGVWDRLTKEH